MPAGAAPSMLPINKEPKRCLFIALPARARVFKPPARAFILADHPKANELQARFAASLQ